MPCFIIIKRLPLYDNAGDSIALASAISNAGDEYLNNKFMIPPFYISGNQKKYLKKLIINWEGL